MVRIAEEVENGAEMRRVCRQEAEEQREEGEVSPVADVIGLVCARRYEHRTEFDDADINKPSSSTLASQYICCSSFQCRSTQQWGGKNTKYKIVYMWRRTFDVVKRRSFDLGEGNGIICFTDELGNVAHRPAEERHPRDQVQVQLPRMRRAAGIVIHAAGQDMVLGPTTPAVRLGARAGLAGVLLDLPALGPSEPVVMPLERLVDGFQVREGEFRVLEVPAVDGGRGRRRTRHHDLFTHTVVKA